MNNASKENMGQQAPLYSGGRREATDLSGGAEGGITCRLRAARGVPHCQGVPGAHSVYFVSSSSVQFGSSVVWSFQTLCNPIDCDTPGLPIHHQLPELAQTDVH